MMGLVEGIQKDGDIEGRPTEAKNYDFALLFNFSTDSFEYKNAFTFLVNCNLPAFRM
jgi:hypothetical protein